MNTYRRRRTALRPGRLGPPGRIQSSQTAWIVVLGVALAATAGVLAGNGSVSLAVVAVAAPAFLLIAVAAPDRTALALITVLPFLFYPAVVGGYSIFLAVPLFGFVSVVILLRERAKLHRLRGLLPQTTFAILAAIAILAATLSENQATAFSRVTYLVLFGVVAAALALSIRSGTLTREAIAKAIVYAGALAATALTIQFTAQYLTDRASVIEWLQGVYPAFGGEKGAIINGFTSNWQIPSPDVLRGLFPFMTPPSAGQFLMLAFVAAMWLRRERKTASSAGSGLLLALTILIGVGLLLTFSRQAWIGAAIGLVALGLTRRPGRMFAVIGGIGALVFIVPIPGSAQTFGSYLLTASDTSTTSSGTRIELWQEALHLMPDHPLIGVGPGLVGTLGGQIFYAHNVFLDAGLELGIPGGLALITLFVLGLRLAWKNGSQIAFGMLTAFVVASFFDDVFLFPRNGLILAAVFAMIASSAREEVQSAANGLSEASWRGQGSSGAGSRSTPPPGRVEDRRGRRPAAIPAEAD
jgi:O-antigen ligase